MMSQISIDSLKAALVKLDANVSVEDILSVVTCSGAGIQPHQEKLFFPRDAF